MSVEIWIGAAAYLGAALCMGLGAVGAAIGEGYTAERASEAIARQPAISDQILKTMLVGQAVAESASIFALVIAILLLFTPWAGGGGMQAMAAVSAGLCMGVGALGPGIGAGLPGGAACLGMARSPRVQKQLTSAMLVGQAVAQTPAVFALLVAFLLLFRPYEDAQASLSGLCAVFSAGLATGGAAVGPGVGAGIVAASACEATARRPSAAPVLLRAMLVGQAVSQSTSIYGLVVSLLLLYAV